MRGRCLLRRLFIVNREKLLFLGRGLPLVCLHGPLDLRLGVLGLLRAGAHDLRDRCIDTELVAFGISRLELPKSLVKERCTGLFAGLVSVILDILRGWRSPSCRGFRLGLGVFDYFDSNLGCACHRGRDYWRGCLWFRCHRGCRRLGCSDGSALGQLVRDSLLRLLGLFSKFHRFQGL